MRVALVLVIVVALLTAACGTPVGDKGSRPPEPSGTGQAGGVCHLVDEATITALTGRDPVSESGFELQGDRTCTWVLHLDPVETITLNVTPAEDFEDGRSGSTDRVEVGEEAYWILAFNGLVSRQGARTVYVTVDLTGQDTKAIATEIAREALSRLP